LELVTEMNAPTDEVHLLDRVLATDDPGYNQTRAVILKAGVVARMNDKGVDLTGTDLRALIPHTATCTRKGSAPL